MEIKSKDIGMLLPILKGLGASAAATLAGSLLAAWLIHKEYAEPETVGYLVTGILLAGGITGGLVAKCNSGKKPLIVVFLTSAAYFLLLLCVGTVLFDGSLQGVFVTMLLVIGSAAAAFLVGTNRKPKRRTRRSRV